MTDSQRIAGLHSLRSRLSHRQRDRPLRYAAVGLAGTLALGGCLVVAVSRWTHSQSVQSQGVKLLALHVEGAQIRADGTVESGDGESGEGSRAAARPVLRFTDGSEIALNGRSRARVRSVDERGAHITLERGEAHVYVVHAQGTHWTFDAGPFVVAVTGTAFRLSWSEDSQRLDVRLENGTVSVTGPASDAPLALRAGQWLTCRGGQGGDVRIRSLDATDEAEGGVTNAEPEADIPGAGPDVPMPEATATGATATGSRGAGASSRRNASHPGHEHDWAAELARGRSEAIVAEAVAMGIDGVFAQCSGEELAALADAARYTHRQDVARGAFLAQRLRFSGSNYAHVAAFGLGRMEDADQNLRAALSWFDTYLAEAPNGRYASEALGHKLMLVKILEGKEAARSLADLYLRRFPNGTYAAAARAVNGYP
jgi:ferric-dicitrate binding protein FerR (iron transport regulator)